MKEEPIRDKVHFVSDGTTCAAWHYPGSNGACVVMAGGLAAVGVIIAAYSSRYLADNLSGWPLAATVSAWASIAAFMGYAVLGSRR
jgi:hypothetical protein